MKQAAIEVIEQTGAQRLANQLLAYPAQIRTQQDAVAEARRGVEDAKAALEQVRAIIVAAVATETNGDGKPKYSNEKAREAEAIKRMATDPEYHLAKKNLRRAEDEYNAALFDVQKLEKEFSAAATAAQLVAAQLNLLARMTA